MKNQKINIIEVMLDLDIGGTQNLVLNLIKGLNKDIFNVNVCCIWAGGALLKEVEAMNVPIHVLNKGDRNDIRIVGRLAKIFKENRIDVVHSHHLGPLVYVFPAAKIVNVPMLIHTEHSYTYLRDSRKRFLLAKTLFNNVNRIVGVCDEVSNFFSNTMKLNPSKISTISNGIDIEKFVSVPRSKSALLRAEFGLCKDDFIVGTVGRLDPVKNHEKLLLAFKEVTERIPTAKLVIIGDGETRSRLDTMIQNLHLNTKAKLIGPRRDIPELLNMLDLFILPSLSEGLSLALLEAMASKKPVIASNVGGNKDVVKNRVNGLLVSPQETSEMANAIFSLYDNKEMKDKIAESGFQMISYKYSISNTIALYENFFKGKNENF